MVPDGGVLPYPAYGLYPCRTSRPDKHSAFGNAVSTLSGNAAPSNWLPPRCDAGSVLHELPDL
ncbi:MAG: hypothetical protein EOM43_16865 [Gammaproteobacteria bacterium]|nr:hypothetical protein [Gammaproteobacteria bacterium]